MNCGEYETINPIDKKPDIKWFKDIKLEPLKWLWPNRIPLGKISLLVGDPGIGKSLLSLYIAAQVSTGRPWADCSTSNKPGSVVILTAEDDLSDTVGIRLKAAGANMGKVCTINAIVEKDKSRNLYNLTKDVDVLIKTIQAIPDVKLVIIDPITAYMEGKNENKNAEVREYLNPLSDLARVADISIIGISHFNKNQMTQAAAYRVLGSIGFTAAVRAVWLVHQDPNNEINRFFVPLKGNLSKNPTGLSYTFVSVSVSTPYGLADSVCCAFSSETIYTTAEQLMAPKDKRSPRRDTAADWLKKYLADGPKFADAILKEALEAGHSERTLRTVKSKLAIQSIKSFTPDGLGKGRWEWSLPT